MIGNKKVGVGVITCNRPHFVEQLLISLKQSADYIDELIVVNDGDKLPDFDASLPPYTLLQNEKNLNVGGSKNRAMRHLLDSNCDCIFTLEDDIIITDSDIFKKYVQASEATGIQHFNFGFSQRENLDQNLKPVYRKVVDYGDNMKIILTKNILGAFTFYTRNALQIIGLHHKSFDRGHGDHLELTYRAYKHGFGTPFWWFADLYGSWDMIENQSNFTTDSVVRAHDFQTRFNEARSTFKTLHGCDIFEIPELSDGAVIDFLKGVKSEG